MKKKINNQTTEKKVKKRGGQSYRKEKESQDGYKKKE